MRIVADNLTDLTHDETGLAGVLPLPGFDLSGGGLVTFSLADRTAYFYVTLALLIGTVALLGAIVRAFAFAVSSALAGLARAVYARYVGILTPSSVVDVDVMVPDHRDVGRRRLAIFYGPVIGAFAPRLRSSC